MQQIGKKALFCLLLVTFSLFIGHSLYADQAISITGTIPPKASDFSLSVTQDAIGTLSQGKTIVYTITYGSHLFYADKLTIEAQWYQGTINGAASPSVDGLEYVTGSSSDAFNATSAVVDLVNQKVSWTINSFPANTTNQTVSFKLKTNSSYTGSSNVTFPVKVRLIAPSFTTSDESVTTSYLFDNTLVTPTPAVATQSTPTPTPTIVPTATPTPATTSTPLSFTDVAFHSVLPTSITLSVQTSVKTVLQTLYGTTTALGATVNDTVPSVFHTIALTDLTPNTTYFVRAVATATTGEKITSEIFSFTTGQIGETPQLNKQSVNFVSTDVILYAAKPDSDPTKPPPPPVLVIPQNISYNFRFQVTKPENIRKVQVIVRNKFVLGISTANADEPNTNVTDLIETQAGVYEGRLESPSTPGTYESFARIFDNKGNIIEEKLADIHVSQPLQVFNKQNQQPIEAAQILFYYYNFRTNTFALLPPQIFPIKNPSYTNLDGQLILPLPAGRYKAHITALGYKQKDIEFVLGDVSGQNYPAILLTEEPFNLITLATYYGNIIQDFGNATKTYIQGISYSVRFFELNAAIAIAILVFLTLVSFSSRIHIPLRFLLSYFIHYAKISAVQRKLGDKIKGRVFDKETGEPVINANVYLIDSEKDSVLSHTATSKLGDFVFATLPMQGYDIQILADGFEPIVYRQSEIHAVELGGYLLSITKRVTNPSFIEHVGIFLQKFLAMWFETLLLASFIFEVSLGFALGWDKAALFLACSLINLCMWIIHLTHLHSEKNLF